MGIQFIQNGRLRTFDLFYILDLAEVIARSGPRPLYLVFPDDQRGSGPGFEGEPANATTFRVDSGFEGILRSFDEGVPLPDEDNAIIAVCAGQALVEPTLNNPAGTWRWWEAEGPDVAYVDGPNGVIDQVIALVSALVQRLDPRPKKGRVIDLHRILGIGFGTGGTHALNLALHMRRYRLRGVCAVAASAGGYRFGRQRDDEGLAPIGMWPTDAAPIVPWVDPDTGRSYLWPDRLLFVSAFTDTYVDPDVDELGEPKLNVGPLDSEGLFSYVSAIATDMGQDLRKALPSWHTLVESSGPWATGVVGAGPSDLVRSSDVLTVGTETPFWPDGIVAGQPSSERVDASLVRWRWTSADGRPSPVVVLVALGDPDGAEIPKDAAHRWPGTPDPDGTFAWGFNVRFVCRSFLADPAAWTADVDHVDALPPAPVPA